MYVYIIISIYMYIYIYTYTHLYPSIHLWPGVALGLSAGLLTAEPAFAGGAWDTQKSGMGGTGKPCEIGA